LGYSLTLGTSLNSQYTYVVSQYTYDSEGNQNLAQDTLTYTQSPKTKLTIPQTNHYGITFVSDGKFLVGAEYTSANWSSFSIGGVNQGLQDSKTYNLGGQITPNINALSNYWATVDYRLGLIYDQSYVNVNNATNNTNTSINNYAITFGLGFPLAPTNTSFYKINLAAEIGREGTLNNGLVKENYVNIHLSFLLNDRWFMKYKLQ
jgi:membrane-bound inhibitor of C-type lysozyme